MPDNDQTVADRLRAFARRVSAALDTNAHNDLNKTQPAAVVYSAGRSESLRPGSSADTTARNVFGSPEDPRPIWIRGGHNIGDKIVDKIREYQGKPTVEAEATQKAIDNLKYQTEMNRIAAMREQLRTGN